MSKLTFFAATALAFATPASAEWLQATSRHFVVYADTNRPTLERQAVELERFDAALRRFFPTGADEDAEANRVTVYVVPSAAAVGRLIGQQDVAGFYVPRVTGSIAFTPRLGGDSSDGALSPRIVLFHEYAHHFLLSGFRAAYPAWFSEGFSELVSTMGERGGGLYLGLAANHRAYGLFNGKPLTLRQLFAPPARMSEEQREALYGRGWLLTHYLIFDAARRAQLETYLRALNAGKPSIDAATAAFGDLSALSAALDHYLDRRSLPAIRMDPASFPPAPIAIRALTGGEKALMAWRIQSTRGVDARSAATIYSKARAAAAPFADDAAAQGWLAEMAFDAGDLPGAEAAADAALSKDPRSSQALLYKARVHLARAVAAKAAPPVWAEARSWIVRANRANNNDAAALALNYDAFVLAGTEPSRPAILGLYRAAELVPQDRGTRFLAARQMVLDGDAAQARTLLRSLAYDPHADADNVAARLLAALDAGKKGQAALAVLTEAEQGNGK